MWPYVCCRGYIQCTDRNPSICQSLGELTTLYPSGGGFNGHADRFVDKAFGVAVGWNYWVGALEES